MRRKLYNWNNNGKTYYVPADLKKSGKIVEWGGFRK
jgi:hypothetical protein